MSRQNNPQQFPFSEPFIQPSPLLSTSLSSSTVALCSPCQAPKHQSRPQNRVTNSRFSLSSRLNSPRRHPRIYLPGLPPTRLQFPVILLFLLHRDLQKIHPRHCIIEQTVNITVSARYILVVLTFCSTIIQFGLQSDSCERKFTLNTNGRRDCILTVAAATLQA